MKTLQESRGGETSREVGLGSSSSSSSSGQRRKAILSKLRDDSSVLDLLFAENENQPRKGNINKYINKVIYFITIRKEIFPINK